MSGILAIGPREREKIADAIASARAKPTPWSAMEEIAIGNDTHTLSLDERGSPERIKEIRTEYPSYSVMLGTYRCALTFEEQPAGMFRHLSVSTHPGQIPSEPVMGMICEAFGFSDFPPLRPYRVWIEEFEPGCHAVNIIELEPDGERAS